MPDVWLVTCAAFPDGEPGGDLLTQALAERGLSSEWVRWDDETVDWSTGGLTAVRSTWDYQHRRDEFLTWAQHVARWSRLLNGAAVFGWNTDKAYLVELAEAGVPVVPTRLLEDPAELETAVRGLEGRVVVKPRVGAGGVGVTVLDSGAAVEDLLGLGAALPAAELVGGPWVVQPLVESVTTEGELSIFVLDGIPVTQAVKRPGAGEIRVHESYGGVTVAAELGAEAAVLAVETVNAAEDLLATELPYARVDAMRLDDGRLVVGELEVTEPGLYLDVLPRNAGKFARMVQDVLARSGG